MVHHEIHPEYVLFWKRDTRLAPTHLHELHTTIVHTFDKIIPIIQGPIPWIDSSIISTWKRELETSERMCIFDYMS